MLRDVPWADVVQVSSGFVLFIIHASLGAKAKTSQRCSKSASRTRLPPHRMPPWTQLQRSLVMFGLSLSDCYRWRWQAETMISLGSWVNITTHYWFLSQILVTTRCWKSKIPFGDIGCNHFYIQEISLRYDTIVTIDKRSISCDNSFRIPKIPRDRRSNMPTRTPGVSPREPLALWPDARENSTLILGYLQY